MSVPAAATPWRSFGRATATAAGLVLWQAAIGVQAQVPDAAPAPTASAPAAAPPSPAEAPALRRIGLRALAATCAGCHGTDGRPADDAMPPLAGRPQAFIAARLRAFQGGQTPATVMHQISRGYTAAQVDALAAYFSGLPETDR